MKYTVVISETAANDLKAIYSYIAYSLKEIGTAEKLLERLEESVMLLAFMPYKYKAYDSDPWKTRGLRQMVVGNYIVFYVPNDRKGVVEIIRVLYGGRDLDSALSENGE